MIFFQRGNWRNCGIAKQFWQGLWLEAIIYWKCFKETMDKSSMLVVYTCTWLLYELESGKNCKNQNHQSFLPCCSLLYHNKILNFQIGYKSFERRSTFFLTKLKAEGGITWRKYSIKAHIKWRNSVHVLTEKKSKW